ncbi:MAG: hypothetical protein R3181_15735, partial [Rubricoccaceae bacterium]|nr:hypothetical protein [Rubricoccaceae bacterium]
MRLPSALSLLVLLVGLGLTGCAITFGPIYAEGPIPDSPYEDREPPGFSILPLSSAASDLECPDGTQKDPDHDIEIYG